MSIGKVHEFDIKSANWTNYIERMEMYFLVNKVTDDLKLPILISSMGQEAYDLLSTLASPSKPATLTYNRAVELLEGHLQPKPSVLAERYKFRQRRQNQNESISDYVAELKKLAKYCDFKTTLDDNLRDQLVCGLKSEVIRQRLFAEEEIKYNRAVTLALSLEAAERDANAVEPSSAKAEEVHKINVACTRCGNNRHRAEDCSYKEYVCSWCQGLGHLRRMCPRMDHTDSRRLAGFAKSSSRYERGIGRGAGGGRGSKAGRGQRGAGRGGRSRAQIHSLNEQEVTQDNVNKYDSEGDIEEPIYQMSLSEYKPVRIKLTVQNCLLNMEVDTGSALSCISKSVYHEYFSHLQLKECNLNLKFYDGSIIQPLGYLEVTVNYKNVSKTLDLYVIAKGTTNLLGRQWLAELRIPVVVSTISQNTHTVHNVSDSKKNIHDIVSRHKALFDGALGKFRGDTAELCVRADAVPIFCRARPVPYALRDRVDAEIDAMLRTGVIEPVSHSDWATPLVVVRKADGGLRICADYKVTLNKVLVVDRFPVPKMEDLFSNLSGNVFFTKLDLSQAYNQIVLSEKSRQYTVINTHRGLFKYSRLVYGLSSSPGIFQKIMVNMLKDVPDVVVFYDDILIKSKDLDSHLESVKKVLQVLERNGLKIKKSKCHFLAKEVKYLGFIINKDGIRVDPSKVQAITTMPHPNNVSELKSFIGMVNFYGKFIKNLSVYLAPLYELLKKGRHWTWGQEQNSVFVKIKKFLCSTKTLVHFDMRCETVVTVDASAHGLGAVLAQREGPGGPERVVAYASRLLTKPELHYSQIHKEALAIVFAVDKFHQYVFGREFILRTDHKPLVSIFGSNMGIPSAAASRLQRWAIKLSAYNFTIEYVKTDKNTADVLSRLIESQKMEVACEKDDLPEQTYLHFATEALLLDYKVLKKETSSDPILSRVLSYIIDGWPSNIEINELKPYYNRKSELYCELGCIMWGHRVIIPATCRIKVLSELHDSHMGIVKTKSLARSYVWWPGIDEAVEATCRTCTVCAAVADAPPAQTPSSWPWPSRPWSRLHLDFLGPIKGITFLVVVDACSKWIEAIRMNKTTAHSVISVLRNLCSKFGLPKQIVSDNGPPFSSAEFKQFLTHNGIEQVFSAPYHPASNGAAENAVKFCKRIIKKAFINNLDINTALCRSLLTYRNTAHSTTGDSPANILQGRSLRMRLDNLKPDRNSLVAARQARSERYAGGVSRQFDDGAQIWYRDYKGNNKWVSGTILKRVGSSDYYVRSVDGTETHRHVDQLKHRVTNSLDTGVPVSKNLDQIAQQLAITRHSRKSLATATLSSSQQQQPDTNAESGSPRVEPETVESHKETTGEVSAMCSPLKEPNASDEPNADTTSSSRPVRTRRAPERFGID